MASLFDRIRVGLSPVGAWAGVGLLSSSLGPGTSSVSSSESSTTAIDGRGGCLDVGIARRPAGADLAEPKLDPRASGVDPSGLGSSPFAMSLNMAVGCRGLSDFASA